MKTSIKPLTCDAAREMMFDYIDGQLGDGDSKRLLFHISECESCKRELAERQEMLALIGSSATAAPEALFNRVMEGIKDIPQEKPNIFTRFRFAYGTAVVAACAVLTVFLVSRGYFIDGGDSLTNDAGVSRADSYDLASGIGTPEHSKIEVEDAAEEEALYCADVSDDVEVYYATTAAVTAAAPEIMADYAIIGGADSSQIVYMEAANKSVLTGSSSSDTDLIAKFDLLYDKICVDAGEAAVIICAEGVISDICASLDEVIVVSDISFTRYVIEADAAQRFTEYLKLLDENSALYRAAVPSDGDILTCEIFILADSE